MKKLLLVAASLLLSGSMVSAQSSRAGGGLSTKAIQALELCFDAFDNFVCGPGAGSSNTTVVNPPGGTGDTVAKWISATVLGDSDLINVGVPAAGASGDILDLTFTVNAMDGSDTIIGFDLDITNANHTGAGNILTVLNIAGITEDSDALESVIAVGSGWNRVINAEDASGSAFISDHVIEIGDGWDSGMLFDSGGTIATTVSGNDLAIQMGLNGDFNLEDSGGTTKWRFTEDQLWGPVTDIQTSLTGTDISINPDNNVIQVGGDAATTVNRMSVPNNDLASTVTFICTDADITFIDNDKTAGVDGLFNLAGAATDFVCAEDDTLTVVFFTQTPTNETRWVEVSRSVNN